MIKQRFHAFVWLSAAVFLFFGIVPADLAAAEAAAVKAAPAQAKADKKADANAAAGSSKEAAKKRYVGRAWWNRPKIVTDLKLTDEQRAKMDKLLVENRDGRSSFQASQRTSQKEFLDALKAGKWKEARAKAAEMGRHSSDQVVSQRGLKISILSLLNDSQRATLGEKHTRGLRGPWPGRRGAGLRCMRWRGGQ